MKAKISLGLARMTVPQKIENARLFISCMSGNSNFINPNPPLSNISNLSNLLERAYILASNGGTEQTAIMYQQEEALDKGLVQLAAYVEYIANGNSAIILSSGMHVKKPGGGKFYTLDAKNGTYTGEVILTCPSIRGAAYLWQILQGPQNGKDHWTNLKIASTAKTTVKGLKPGDKYWFRVSTITKNVEKEFTDPISIIVQ
jgi:hypothetical protein